MGRSAAGTRGRAPRPLRSRRLAAALILSLALGASAGACGNRDNEAGGNAGQDPQTKGAPEGQNPAVEAETTP